MERLKEMFQEMLSRVTGQEQLQQQLSEELAAKVRAGSSPPRTSGTFGAGQPKAASLRGSPLPP